MTGDVYEAYVDKNIFRPLGMRRAYFDVTPWGLLPYRSNHYFLRDGKREEGGLDFNTGITVSNGGLNAPVPDMARWLGFLLGAPPDGVDGDAILKRSSLEEMWKTVVPIGDSDIGRESMGLCFFLYDDGTPPPGGSHGDPARTSSPSSCWIPAAGVGVVAVSNTVGTTPRDPNARAILDRARAGVVHGIFPLFRKATR